ncbi:MAG: NUDIX hydrolase [Candidatus Eremiobacteraeota bacterium]|nr:NUDIX hydrolase [Candidatus Eremiobacteraeota bacterium]
MKATHSAVIPLRRKDGCLEVLLITSRRTGRWIIPKGFIEHELSPQESALKEAWEEAGLEGEATGGPLGTFLYQRKGNEWNVEVYLMHVTAERDHWPEENERQKKWVSLDEALELVDDEELRRLVRTAFSLEGGNS